MIYFPGYKLGKSFGLIVFCLFVFLSCSRNDLQSNIEQAPIQTGSLWPVFPESPDDTIALIERYTQRGMKIGLESAISSTEIISKISPVHIQNLVVGQQEITQWLQQQMEQANNAGKNSFLIIGSYHDSPGHITAFRRLIGPSGIQGLSHIIIEQFRATGHWKGVPVHLQKGDTQAIQSFLRTYQIETWRQLERSQFNQNYTAWRYDALPEVMDLLVTARATSLPLHGCDMPQSLQKIAVKKLGTSNLDNLRELHCLISFREHTQNRENPLRAALFWGDSHLRPKGFSRFLPPEDHVILLSLVGQRHSLLSLEGSLFRENLILNSPVIVPIDRKSNRFALLLSRPPLNGKVIQSRYITQQDIAEPHSTLDILVGAANPGIFYVENHSIHVSENMKSLKIVRKKQPYIFQGKQGKIIGHINPDESLSMELFFDLEKKTTRIISQLIK